MMLRIHPENPDARRLGQAVQLLESDGVLVVPTDTVYCYACALGSSRGLDRLARLKGTTAEKAQFSLLCTDLSQLSVFSKPVSNEVFKLMRRTLPGPYTFILEATTQVPKLFRSNKKTIGIRIPDNGVARALIEALGRPLIVSSVHDPDWVVEYTTDPELIEERCGDRVDAVIDGGPGGLIPSTILDCTGGDIELVRAGAGPWEE